MLVRTYVLSDTIRQIHIQPKLILCSIFWEFFVVLTVFSITKHFNYMFVCAWTGSTFTKSAISATLLSVIISDSNDLHSKSNPLYALCFIYFSTRHFLKFPDRCCRLLCNSLKINTYREDRCLSVKISEMVMYFWLINTHINIIVCMNGAHISPSFHKSVSVNINVVLYDYVDKDVIICLINQRIEK